MARGEDERRLVCRCMGIASHRVAEAIGVLELATVSDITRAVRAGGGCSLCHTELEEMLVQAQGLPVDPDQRRENRWVCRKETQARVSSVIDRRIRPRLALSGAQITRIDCEGLEVVVTTTPDLDPELRDWITRCLRERVCPDLVVEVQAGAKGAGAQ